MSPAANDEDREIGATIARLRGGRSQQWLANEMRTLREQWRWSQATVWALEKGERPLRLAEARDLATVLGVSVESLLDPTPANPDQDWDSVAASLFDAERELEHAQTDLEAAQEDVRQAQMNVSVAVESERAARDVFEMVAARRRALTEKVQQLKARLEGVERRGFDSQTS